MLESVTTIEGLDGAFEDVEMFDDTPPGSMQVVFLVASEEMPFLSEQAGHTVRQNFIHVRKTWDLGRTVQERRINDKVKFDEITKKWKIERLDPRDSDIKRHQLQWNAFMKGVSADDAGTPLLLLFKSDPSRVEFFKDFHIGTVEHLAGLNENDIQNIGNNCRQDVERAKRFLQKVKENAPSVEMNLKIEEKDRQIASLQAQLSDLSEKLTQLLQAQLEGQEEPKPKRGRPRKEAEQTDTGE